MITVRYGGDIMSVTATELKMNLGKYLLLSATEDIFITKNGRVIAKLSNPFQDRVNLVESITGIIPSDVDADVILKERLENI